MWELLNRGRGGKRKMPRTSLSVDERWKLIDSISKQVVLRGKYKHTLKDVISDLSVRPMTGIPLALAVLFGFWAFFGAFAGFFTDGFAVPAFDDHFLPAIPSAFPGEGGPLYWIFVGDPGAPSCFEAFGVLTSGLFVAFGVVLPAIVAFYLVLTILEDTGYLPRLAVLVDTVFHKIGLHGFAIVPTILSLGCNVPAVAASRVLETKKQRFMMMSLLAVFIPCGAQIGVMEELLPEYVPAILAFLFFGYFVTGAVLSRLIPGRSPEILIDVPPYRSPIMKNVATKTWARVSGFIKMAVPAVLGGIVVVNLLYLLGVIDWLADALEPIFVVWFGVPAVTVGALVMAFLRKDMAVGMLGGMAAAGLLTTGELITSVVLVSIYFPCLATFIMLWKEGGVRDLLKSLAILTVSFFVFGGLMHGIVALAGV
ncbi:MAG TPA: ferrous iron transporter B [Hadesarchaea archaeon]|nr:ferrous iron transporter B [Hadesarchaea archaeon]